MMDVEPSRPARDRSPPRPGALPAPDFRIRDAAASDLPRILEVETASFSMPWSPASFRSLLGRERVRFLVAEEAGRPVGHAVLWWVAEEGELANIAVAPEARRRGVASRLLDRVLDEAERAGIHRIFLEVRASNDGAVALYRRRGFHEVGLRRDYYADPREDARVFRLDLAGAQ